MLFGLSDKQTGLCKHFTFTREELIQSDLISPQWRTFERWRYIPLQPSVFCKHTQDLLVNGKPTAPQMCHLLLLQRGQNNVDV